MKVKLLKDVSLPHNGTDEKAPTGPPVVGQAGQVVDLSDPVAKAYIKRKLAKEVDDSEKSDKAADERKTKPGKGPAETK